MAGLAATLAAPAASATAAPVRSFAARAGAVFVPPPADPYRAPLVQRIALPTMPGAQAIWGATGRDDAGHIWAGVSGPEEGAPGLTAPPVGAGPGSAHLCRHDPATGRTLVMGDVRTNLTRLGRLRAGESQVKIHSRIVQADDGALYFTSTDEAGEVEDGSAPPRWGSHMWRTRPDSDRWEHLLAVPEGLTCGAVFGRWAYALGLWDHVLYRYDTATGAVRRTVVGAPGGHMSRNFLVDRRGHAFVPRVRRIAGGLAASLVEFDTDLAERAATPLSHYADRPAPGASHGITALVALADGAIVFATSLGYLHRIEPAAGATPATIRPLGWFHPAGTGYASGLDSWDGGSLIAGIVARPRAPGMPWAWDWVVRDLASGKAHARPLAHGLGEQVVHLYGSQTADARGRFHFGGRYHDGPYLRPVLLRVDAFGG